MSSRLTPIFAVPGDTPDSKGWILHVWPGSSSGPSQGFPCLLRSVLCCLWYVQASGREGAMGSGGRHDQAWAQDGSELPQHLPPLTFCSQGQQGKGQKVKRNLIGSLILLPGILGLLAEARLLGVSAARPWATKGSGGHCLQNHRSLLPSPLPFFPLYLSSKYRMFRMRHFPYQKSYHKNLWSNTIQYHLYVESKMWHKWTYRQNRNRLTDIENRLLVAKGRGGGGGLDWEFGISRCQLLYIESINNKVLLYSTGNYIQYPVINHNGKEYEKEYICTYA